MGGWSRDDLLAAPDDWPAQIAEMMHEEAEAMRRSSRKGKK